MSMLTVGILSLLLFILYVIHIIRVYSFVTGCHQFIQDCNVDGSRVVNAVAAPRYACADYNVQDYLNFTYWASTSTATYWSYGVLFGLVVILSLMASVIALVYTVRLRSGILVTREAPVTYAYTINTNGVTMARGTQPDADNVAVGIPVDKP
ncbi:hypothetical protein Pmar_PMAR026908 [Perkinsus marinus ATCC 50983]|uniref:Uncharacterized protein n=1 Tax=Perkinsus marinus (strain ATCC 50983 / TXsc) TaxID=423536 RepID=C5L5B1_PERM5|nr:hypothetical protein Pmar_PMAR026908 [Perkinsus marinus ATCC 50983]EER08082.1 hypothetical protein Pmar_PMAR026908 [Perkinsus marinus ATCC 50983]|eukprot:XP_002776266.1 hypothetical protein Pmar_PMAR026908 [Perkinsus marinus ATCC 50983]